MDLSNPREDYGPFSDVGYTLPRALRGLVVVRNHPRVDMMPGLVQYWEAQVEFAKQRQ